MMQRIAVPMIGGMVSSTVLTLAVIPVIYAAVKEWGLPALPPDTSCCTCAHTTDPEKSRAISEST
jgi:Cu(I)/Ag(I) efflux system membrane protein CusA/SilA